VILDGFESSNRSSDRVLIGGVDTKKQIETVEAQLDLLEIWVGEARSTTRSEGSNNAYQQLSHAYTSNVLGHKIDSMKTKIDMMPGQTDLMDRLKAVEDSILYFV
jgi:hypothetical protein